ncbi:MAG: glycosyltransferase family 4 protein [Planctomycetaceae bacterium]|nr:glycosyltransferase family 4 protein [Planctomycetales bacterium]MCB9927025.1 glycosyltransferase family 4 protein [Planctomycetaceae bacterium]
MRIAHVITRMIVGGAQENTLFTCDDLVREHGDDVLLITGPALGPEGDLLTQGRGGQVPVAYVPSLRRAIHPWQDLRSYYAIKNLLRNFKPDVVHTHSAKGGMLGRLAAHALNVPAIVHTVHGAPFHPYQNGLSRELFRQCEKYAARCCHRLISVADAMTDLMVDAQVAGYESFTTIYSGMDVEPFLHANEHRDRVRAELGFKPEHIVVGKIARLFHLKGHEYVLAAAAQAVKTFPNLRLLFIGDGILRTWIDNYIEEVGLEEHVVFTGLVPPSQIPELVGAMDVLVHASLREGLARALPQALIAGKPVISYDIDGAREVVIPDETGFLLEPKSIEPMSVAMVQLANDGQLRERLGSEGQRRFAKQFRHQYMTNEIRRVYEEILAERKRH